MSRIANLLRVIEESPSVQRLRDEEKGLHDKVKKIRTQIAASKSDSERKRLRDEEEDLAKRIFNLRDQIHNMTTEESKSEAMFSSGEKMALTIIKKSLDKNGGFAVYRQGIGTDYFDTEEKAQAHIKDLKAKGHSQPAPMMLTKDSSIFKELGKKGEAQEPAKEPAPAEPKSPKTIGMQGELLWNDEIGLIFTSTNESGETMAIVIPVTKEALLQVLNGGTAESSLSEAKLEEIIKKEGSHYVLRSRKTGKVLGRHKSKASAERQERAIQAHKHGG